MTNDSSSDDLILRFRAGDEAALGALWHRHHSRLLRYIVRTSGGALDRADAEDIAQDAWLRAWRARDHFEPGRHFLPWISTIARRLTLTKLRRTRPPDALLVDARARWRGEEPPGPEAELDYALATEALRHALGELTDIQRRVIRADLAGEDPAATDEDPSAGALRKRRYDARRVVRRRLREIGYDGPA